MHVFVLVTFGDRYQTTRKKTEVSNKSKPEISL